MIFNILLIILGMIFSPLVHELGHFLAIKKFDRKLKYTRNGFRLIWEIDSSLNPEENLYIVKSGFASQFFFQCILWGLLAIGINFNYFAIGYSIASFTQWWIYPGYNLDNGFKFN